MNLLCNIGFHVVRRGYDRGDITDCACGRKYRRLNWAYVKNHEEDGRVLIRPKTRGQKRRPS